MSSILVIDDSLLARERLAGILRAGGNEVFEATNGCEGLEKAESHKPECIVLDLLMPGMNGIEVLRELNERNLNIPVIIVSADIQETTKKKCMDLGAVAFMNKPFNEKELTEVVHGILCTNY